MVHFNQDSIMQSIEVAHRMLVKLVIRKAVSEESKPVSNQVDVNENIPKNNESGFNEVA